MLVNSAGPTRLRSGPVVIDRNRREAYLAGRALSLSGLPLRILEELIAADGDVVTRVELKRKFWPYAERIDTERRLNTAVRALREALGDTAAEARLITTIRKHGYRWIGAEQECETKRPFLQLAAAACLALSAAPITLDRPAAAGPGSPDRKLAWTYVNEGRPDAALPHIATLLQSAKSDKADTGWLILRSGMPEAALATCSGDSSPDFNLLSCRQTALARLGLVPEARAVGVDIMRLANADPALIAGVAAAPAPLGYQRFLRWRIDAFVRPDRDWFQRAQLQADAGLYGQALASLERASAVGDPLLAKIGSTAEFRPLHSSPTYRRIASAVLATARVS